MHKRRAEVDKGGRASSSSYEYGELIQAINNSIAFMYLLESTAGAYSN